MNSSIYVSLNSNVANFNVYLTSKLTSQKWLMLQRGWIKLQVIKEGWRKLIKFFDKTFHFWSKRSFLLKSFLFKRKILGGLVMRWAFLSIRWGTTYKIMPHYSSILSQLSTSSSFSLISAKTLLKKINVCGQKQFSRASAIVSWKGPSFQLFPFSFQEENSFSPEWWLMTP